MADQGQATVEGIGIAAAIAVLLALLALALGPSAGTLGAALAGALGHALAPTAGEHPADGLTSREHRLAEIVRHGGGGGDAPDLADLSELLDARLGPVAGRLLLTRLASELAAAEPAHPCVIPGIYGSHETYSPVTGSSPSVRVATREQQDRWVRDALADHPLAELARTGAGLIPLFAPAIAFAEIAQALPENAPPDGIEPGQRAGDIVIEQAVAGGVNAARETVRVRVLRSVGGSALRVVRDALVQQIYPRWTHPCA